MKLKLVRDMIRFYGAVGLCRAAVVVMRAAERLYPAADDTVDTRESTPARHPGAAAPHDDPGGRARAPHYDFGKGR